MNRRGLLRRFFMFLEARQHELETGECSFTCDSLRLGSLIKQMKVHGLPWHRENENLEYVGLAPESVAKEILEFQNSTSKVTSRPWCSGRCGGDLLGCQATDELVNCRPTPFGLILLPGTWR